jgi:quinol monooxygenase YgiN
MPYVVSATWTANPGQEDVVRGAIENLTPPSRAEEGNLLYQAYQDPAEPSVFRLFEVYADEAAYAAHGASDHFRPTRWRPRSPCSRTASVRSTRPWPESAVRLAAFRRPSDQPGERFVGLVLGQGAHLRIHPFPTDADLVVILAQTCDRREQLADEAAANDGLTLDEVLLLPPVYPTSMRDFLTFEAHVDGMERGHGAPRVPEDWYTAPIFLFMAPHAVTGPYDGRGDAPGHERLDFELELAAIVCRDVRNASVEDARSASAVLRDERLGPRATIQGREMKLKLARPRARTSPPPSDRGS